MLNLLRGTLRTFTGLLASTNRDKFVMKTRVATVGIRGSGNILYACEGQDCDEGVDGRRRSSGGRHRQPHHRGQPLDHQHRAGPRRGLPAQQGGAPTAITGPGQTVLVAATSRPLHPDAALHRRGGDEPGRREAGRGRGQRERLRLRDPQFLAERPASLARIGHQHAGSGRKQWPRVRERRRRDHQCAARSAQPAGHRDLGGIAFPGAGRREQHRSTGQRASRLCHLRRLRHRADHHRRHAAGREPWRWTACRSSWAATRTRAWVLRSRHGFRRSRQRPLDHGAVGLSDLRLRRAHGQRLVHARRGDLSDEPEQHRRRAEPGHARGELHQPDPRGWTSP